MLHKITPILNKTAEATGYTQEQVASVIAHCFETLKQFTLFPTKAGIRIPYVGVIRTSIKRLNFYLLRDGIRLVREGKLSKERFKYYWNLRTLVRKDEERRDFKSRFGYVFNPDWRQSDDPADGDPGAYDDGGWIIHPSQRTGRNGRGKSEDETF